MMHFGHVDRAVCKVFLLVKKYRRDIVNPLFKNRFIKIRPKFSKLFRFQQIVCVQKKFQV
jgi:hypothetical protein